MIRFLHAADLHLGLRITRFDESACNRIGEARFEALEQLRAEAVRHQVQFIVISGDLFDDHSVSRSVAERAFTLFEGKTLGCPVYIIAGNHDPLTSGGVWDREPWSRENPGRNIRLFRAAKPEQIENLPVTLFPCPLNHRNSIDDPTAWIANYPRSKDDKTVRIGLAHGSLNLFPNLPLDDHLIRRDAAEHLSLDYLALGHWHKPLMHPSSDGVVRTAYSGTHEPMRFPELASGISTGWSSYSADGDAERFHDGGRGTAMVVTIDEAGVPPNIETIEVGRLRWQAEDRDVTSRPLGEIIAEFAEREGRERTLLRLTLSGVLDPDKHQRIETVLRDIVQNRYCPGSSLHAEKVMVTPNQEQLGSLVGDAVLSRVLGRLQDDMRSADVSANQLAAHALKLLYRIAWEEQPK